MASARRWDSPLGSLLIRCTPLGLTELEFSHLAFSHDEAGPELESSDPTERALLDAAAAWLEEYFTWPARAPRARPPALSPAGTAFEHEVWRALGALPYGEVVTYGDIARRLGRPRGACRAVGQANAKNPLPLFVPCHRVVAAGGKLGGYSAGLERKLWLLAHENRDNQRQVDPRSSPMRGEGLAALA